MTDITDPSAYYHARGQTVADLDDITEILTCDRGNCRRHASSIVPHGASTRFVCQYHLQPAQCDGCGKECPRYELGASGNEQGGEGSFCEDCLGYSPREDW